jgi:hypothetical protein
MNIHDRREFIFIKILENVVAELGEWREGFYHSACVFP